MPPKKRKILYFITKSNFGGAQRYVYDLASSLPREEFDVAVVMGGEGLLKKKLEERNVRVITIPNLIRDINLSDISLFFKIGRILRNERPDIIHTNGPKIGGVVAFVGRILGIPKIIYTSHGWTFRENRPFIQKILISLLSWLIVLLSHETITVSYNEKEAAGFMPFVQHKFRTIYNGVTRPKFLVRKVSEDRIAPFLVGQKKLLWIGTIAELHPNKGLEFGIEAFAELLKTHPSLSAYYIIIGDGELRQELQRKAELLGVGPRVIFTGFIPNASDLLKAFDIFLFPSIKEGLPYTLIEAGHAGLPVIASHVGGIPEIVQDMGSGILVAPERSGDLAKALAFLVEHKSYRISLKRELEKHVREKFSLREMIEKTVKVYDI